MDDDDEKGSRGIPSRTKFGKRAAFLEKFPGYGQPLVLFWGLITIQNWGLKMLPVALMEVMMADMPHVLYGKDAEEGQYTDEELEKYKIQKNNLLAKAKQGGLFKNINLNNTKSASYLINKAKK